MRAYLDLLEDVLVHGESREDRTGVGTLSVFGRQVRYDLGAGFPLLTTKRLHWRSIVVELLWFLRGDSNIDYLRSHGVSIWDEWADSRGDLGPVYGKQWRSWAGADGSITDQIRDLIDGLRCRPYSRRHIVSAWNVSDVPRMALPPCHCLFQFYVSGGRLSCQLYQRSADIFLGVPFNIASYALLTELVARACDLRAGSFIHVFGDLHLYKNHVAQAREQLSRAPYGLPELRVKSENSDIFSYAPDDFELYNYRSHASISAPIAV